MDLQEGMTLDGFHVSAEIEPQGDGTFRIAFATMPHDSNDDDQMRRLWPAPGAPVFKAEELAARHARYMMLGIRRISVSGKPEFTVV